MGSEKRLLKLYDLRLELDLRSRFYMSVSDSRLSQNEDIPSPRAKGSPSFRYPRSYSVLI